MSKRSKKSSKYAPITNEAQSSAFRHAQISNDDQDVSDRRDQSSSSQAVCCFISAVPKQSTSRFEAHIDLSLGSSGIIQDGFSEFDSSQDSYSAQEKRLGSNLKQHECHSSFAVSSKEAPTTALQLRLNRMRQKAHYQVLNPYEERVIFTEEGVKHLESFNKYLVELHVPGLGFYQASGDTVKQAKHAAADRALAELGPHEEESIEDASPERSEISVLYNFADKHKLQLIWSFETTNQASSERFKCNVRLVGSLLLWRDEYSDETTLQDIDENDFGYGHSKKRAKTVAANAMLNGTVAELTQWIATTSSRSQRQKELKKALANYNLPIFRITDQPVTRLHKLLRQCGLPAPTFHSHPVPQSSPIMHSVTCVHESLGSASCVSPTIKKGKACAADALMCDLGYHGSLFECSAVYVQSVFDDYFKKPTQTVQLPKL